MDEQQHDRLGHHERQILAAFEADFRRSSEMPQQPRRVAVLSWVIEVARFRPVLIPLGLLVVALGLSELAVAASGALLVTIGLHSTIVTARYSPRCRRFWNRLWANPIEAARHPG